MSLLVDVFGGLSRDAVLDQLLQEVFAHHDLLVLLLEGGVTLGLDEDLEEVGGFHGEDLPVVLDELQVVQSLHVLLGPVAD